jgi:tape measure domain-containing protein
MAGGVTVRELVTKWTLDADSSSVKNFEKNLESAKRTAKTVAVALTAAATSIGFFLNEAGKLEQTKIAFEVLLGSADEAKTLLEDLFEFAKKTPFTIPGILDNAKLLRAYGIEADKIIPTLNALGNISAAVGVDKLPRLALALGQVKAATRLRGQELRQFTEAGVDLLSELGKILGKSAAEIQDLVSQGAISFELVDQALTNLTTGSGRFSNLMQRQSKTFFGIISNIKDAIIVLSAEVGESLLPAAKELTEEFLNFVEANKELIKGKLIEYLKIAVRFTKDFVSVMKTFFIVGKRVTEALGGAERTLKLFGLALLSIFTFKTLSIMGSFVLLIKTLTLGFIGLGAAGTAASIGISLIPAAIGAAIALIALIIEDIVGFFQGKDSVTGLIVEAFKNMGTTVKEFVINKFLEMVEGIKNIFKKFLKGLPLLFESIIDFLLEPFIRIKETIEGILEGIKKIKSLTPEGVGEKLKTGAEKVGGGLKEFLGKTSPFFSNLGLFSEDNDQVQRVFDTSSPSPLRSGQQNNNVNINSPITIQVPENTDPAQIGERVQVGVSDAIQQLLRDTFRSVQPLVES